MNLIGGHGGKSGRLNQMEETAEEYGFLLNLLESNKSQTQMLTFRNTGSSNKTQR